MSNNIYKHYIALSVATLLLSGCASFGPKVLIETPVPAEDFVVLCEWYVDPMLDFHGGGKLSKQNVYVAKSGEEVDCGVAVGGDALVRVMHPVYSDADVIERDGLTIYRYNKTKLDVLAEQKSEFESKDKTLFSDIGYGVYTLGYARKSAMLCGFPHKYLDYYFEVKNIDKEKFRKLYHESILECKKLTFPLLNKYSPNSYPGKRPSPDESMNHLWSSKGWEKYK